MEESSSSQGSGDKELLVETFKRASYCIKGSGKGDAVLISSLHGALGEVDTVLAEMEQDSEDEDSIQELHNEAQRWYQGLFVDLLLRKKLWAVRLVFMNHRLNPLVPFSDPRGKLKTPLGMLVGLLCSMEDELNGLIVEVELDDSPSVEPELNSLSDLSEPGRGARKRLEDAEKDFWELACALRLLLDERLASIHVAYPDVIEDGTPLVWEMARLGAARTLMVLLEHRDLEEGPVTMSGHLSKSADNTSSVVVGMGERLGIFEALSNQVRPIVHVGRSSWNGGGEDKDEEGQEQQQQQPPPPMSTEEKKEDCIQRMERRRGEDVLRLLVKKGQWSVDDPHMEAQLSRYLSPGNLLGAAILCNNSRLVSILLELGAYVEHDYFPERGRMFWDRILRSALCPLTLACSWAHVSSDIVDCLLRVGVGGGKRVGGRLTGPDPGSGRPVRPGGTEEATAGSGGEEEVGCGGEEWSVGLAQCNEKEGVAAVVLEAALRILNAKERRGPVPAGTVTAWGGDLEAMTKAMAESPFKDAVADAWNAAEERERERVAAAGKEGAAPLEDGADPLEALDEAVFQNLEAKVLLLLEVSRGQASGVRITKEEGFVKPRWSRKLLARLMELELYTNEHVRVCFLACADLQRTEEAEFILHLGSQLPGSSLCSADQTLHMCARGNLRYLPLLINSGIVDPFTSVENDKRFTPLLYACLMDFKKEEDRHRVLEIMLKPPPPGPDTPNEPRAWAIKRKVAILKVMDELAERLVLNRMETLVVLGGCCPSRFIYPVLRAMPLIQPRVKMAEVRSSLCRIIDLVHSPPDTPGLGEPANCDDSTILHAAIKADDVDIMRHLLPKLSKQQVEHRYGDQKVSVLHLAVENCSAGVLQALLEFGISVDEHTSPADVKAHSEAAHRHVGVTPLWQVMHYKGKDDVVEVLLKFGANPLRTPGMMGSKDKSRKNVSPMDVAKVKGPAYLAFIKQYMKERPGLRAKYEKEAAANEGLQRRLAERRGQKDAAEAAAKAQASKGSSSRGHEEQAAREAREKLLAEEEQSAEKQRLADSKAKSKKKKGKGKGGKGGSSKKGEKEAKAAAGASGATPTKGEGDDGAGEAEMERKEGGKTEEEAEMERKEGGKTEEEAAGGMKKNDGGDRVSHFDSPAPPAPPPPPPPANPGGESMAVDGERAQQAQQQYREEKARDLGKDGANGTNGTFDTGAPSTPSTTSPSSSAVADAVSPAVSAYESACSTPFDSPLQSPNTDEEEEAEQCIRAIMRGTKEPQPVSREEGKGVGEGGGVGSGVGEGEIKHEGTEQEKRMEEYRRCVAVEKQDAAFQAQLKVWQQQRPKKSRKRYLYDLKTGNSMIMAGKLYSALMWLTELIERHDPCTEALLNRAWVFLLLDEPRPNECLLDVSKVLSKDTENRKALFRRAEALRLLGDLDGAYRDLSRLEQLEPGNPQLTDAMSRVQQLQDEDMDRQARLLCDD